MGLVVRLLIRLQSKITIPWQRFIWQKHSEMRWNLLRAVIDHVKLNPGMPVTSASVGEGVDGVGGAAVDSTAVEDVIADVTGIPGLSFTWSITARSRGH
jgi:hypothetical protein